jgi:hemerythrin
MEFFKWKDGFNIGNAEIDLQHRSFLELLNEYYISTSGDMKDVVGVGLVEKLKEYAAMHFRFEEDLMESMGYEGLSQQREQHRYFKTLVSDLESAHRQGKRETLKSAVPFLRDWFLRHILEEDRKLTSCLKQEKQSPG